MNNHYHTLGCRSDMTREEIKKKYMDLMLLVHPDKSPADAERAAQVISAWRVLGDQDKRKEYDKMLSAKLDRDERLNYRFVSTVEKHPDAYTVTCLQCGEQNSAEDGHQRIECVACSMLIDLS
jgi:DnaJ-class molecular chaperone